MCAVVVEGRVVHQSVEPGPLFTGEVILQSLDSKVWLIRDHSWYRVERRGPKPLKSRNVQSASHALRIYEGALN